MALVGLALNRCTTLASRVAKAAKERPRLTGKSAQGGSVSGKVSLENGYASLSREVQTGLSLIQVNATQTNFFNCKTCCPDNQNRNWGRRKTNQSHNRNTYQHTSCNKYIYHSQ